MLRFTSGIWFGFDFISLIFRSQISCLIVMYTDLFSLDNILTRNPKFKIVKDAIFNPSQQSALLIVSAFCCQKCATSRLLCLCCALCRITVSRFGSLLKICQPGGGIYIWLFFLVSAGQFLSCFTSKDDLVEERILLLPCRSGELILVYVSIIQVAVFHFHTLLV